ncbi:hypothetical protein KUCAC02_008181, partial [Chaenocephalus aceratus]
AELFSPPGKNHPAGGGPTVLMPGETRDQRKSQTAAKPMRVFGMSEVSQQPLEGSDNTLTAGGWGRAQRHMGHSKGGKGKCVQGESTSEQLSVLFGRLLIDNTSGGWEAVAADQR